MADLKISELTALAGANVVATDVLPIVDVSATTTKKITASELSSYVASVAPPLGVRPIASSVWNIPSPAPLSLDNSFSTSVGRMVAVPFFVSQAVTVTRMTCQVTTAGTGTSIARLGIYDSSTSTLEPSALVADAGTVTCDTTGKKTISSLSISLGRGTYWAVLVVNSATVVPLFRGHFDVNVQGIWQTNSDPDTGVSCLVSSSSVTGALPATFSVNSSQFANRRCPTLVIGL